MPSTNIVNGTNCIHSNYLFSHPLCKEQSLLKRIANVAFHVLTLGIPLAIYHVIYCCYSIISSKQESENLQIIAVNSVQQNKSVKPYSDLGQKALDFARKKLEEDSKIVPFNFNPIEKHQPSDRNIALLTTLYQDLREKFNKLIAQNKNPWSNPEVIETADELMKIAYAVSNLTLDDLDSFTKTLSSKGHKRTYAQALTKQDSYQYHTFYFCTSIYHLLRGNLDSSLFYPKVISEAHASPFYKQGNIQNAWNELYNDYCDRVRLYVNENDLRAADNRHLAWIKKDTEITSFKSTPDTQPT